MADFKIFMKPGGKSATVTRQVPDGSQGEVSLRSWTGDVTVTCQHIDDRDVYFLSAKGDIDLDVSNVGGEVNFVEK